MGLSCDHVKSTSSVAAAATSRQTWSIRAATVDIPGRKLPTRDAVAARMDQVCRDVAADATDDLDFTWSQESPTREQWDAGQRYGICWVPD